MKKNLKTQLCLFVIFHFLTFLPAKGADISIRPSNRPHSLLFKSTAAQTISSDTTWTMGDTIYVNQNLIIAPQTQLTIEPGVRIEFTGHFAIFVQGLVSALGAEGDTIRFTAQDSLSGWAGIHLMSSDSSADTTRFTYCRFEYVNNSEQNDSLRAVISILDSSRLALKNSLFIYNNGYLGGGLYFENSGGSTLAHNEFSENTAVYGGAVYVKNAEVTSTGNRYRANSSTFGGAVFLTENSILHSDHEVFEGNRASKNGGAVFLMQSTAYLKENEFWDHSAEYGGILSASYSHIVLEDSWLANSISTYYGGALIIKYDSHLQLTGNTFQQMQSNFGGVIFASDNSTVEAWENSFYDNYAQKNGGVLYVSGSELLLVNNVLARNQADYGAALTSSYSNVRLFNCTIADNHAVFLGGALYFNSSNMVNATNTIFWNNRADSLGSQMYVNFAEVHLIYCDVQGDSSHIEGIADTLIYENNISMDPLFTGLQETPYTLGFNSPCLDGGIPDTSLLDVYMETDILGEPRIKNGRIDMGAYEGAYATALDPQRGLSPVTDKLLGNYPNPFNPTTIISYEISRPGRVKLTVYNALGQRVKELVDRQKIAGKHSVVFDGDGLPSGVYFYVLKTEEYGKAGKMVLLR